MERNIEVLPLITSAFLRFTNDVFNVSFLQFLGLYLKKNMNEKDKSFVLFHKCEFNKDTNILRPWNAKAG